MIEQDLTRIANALEVIASALSPLKIAATVTHEGMPCTPNPSSEYIEHVEKSVKEVAPEPVKEVAPEVKEVTPEVKEVTPEVKEVTPEVKEVTPEPVKEVTETELRKLCLDAVRKFRSNKEKILEILEGKLLKDIPSTKYPDIKKALEAL